MHLKCVIIELNNSVEGFKGRLDQAEERISDLEDASIELSNLRGKKKKKRMERNEESLQD